MADRPQQMTAYPQVPAEPRATAFEETVEHYVREFDAFSAQLSREPQARTALRRRAIERFAALGFPTRKNEDWHFTSVAPIASRAFSLSATGSSEIASAELGEFQFGHAEWPALVFVNGRFEAGLSNVPAVPGLTLSSLASTSGEIVDRHLGQVVDFSGSAFTALNTAFFSDGAVVHVERDAVIDSPIHLVFISDPAEPDAVTHPRNLIVVERNARVAVIESYIGLSRRAYFTNAVTEAVVGDGARLDHLKIQRESLDAFHVGTSDARQARNSVYESFSYATGAALSRTNIYTVLDGEGAGTHLNGLYMVDGEQHVDHQTRIEHAKPNCTSHEVYKGVLDGRSHAVFNGKVYVRREAQKTDGKQENNNLLLSAEAQIDTKPQLEIFADDVKCTHGATVGRLDEHALFYLRSRGIEPGRARTLLTYAFAASVLEEITLDDVRNELEAIALRRVGGAY